MSFTDQSESWGEPDLRTRCCASGGCETATQDDDESDGGHSSGAHLLHGEGGDGFDVGRAHDRPVPVHAGGVLHGHRAGGGVDGVEGGALEAGARLHRRARVEDGHALPQRLEDEALAAGVRRRHRHGALLAVAKFKGGGALGFK
eukprot:1126849-Prorocentrum_minimum.AAC.1